MENDTFSHVCATIWCRGFCSWSAVVGNLSICSEAGLGNVKDICDILTAWLVPDH